MKHIALFAVAAVVVLVGLYVILHDQATAPEVTPEAPAPSVPNEEVVESPETPVIPDDIAAHIAEKRERIVMTSPAPYETISSPVTITGEARGNWFFEASFPVTIVNWDGLIIGEGIATADGDWMTTEFVPYTAEVYFSPDPNAYSQNGAIILQRDNPSGLPEYDEALEIPVVFSLE